MGRTRDGAATTRVLVALVRSRATSFLRTGLLSAFLLVLASVTGAAAAGPAPIRLTRFPLDGGSSSGALYDGTQLVLADGASGGTWTSVTTSPGFAFTRLVASWNADTPAQGRVTRGGAGRRRRAANVRAGTPWRIGPAATAPRWLVSLTRIGRVDTDTLRRQLDPFASYALRVRLERASAGRSRRRACGCSARRYQTSRTARARRRRRRSAPNPSS